MNSKLLTVVIPTYNEEGNIELLVSKLERILRSWGNYQLLFVDDGSKDKSLSILQRLSSQTKYVKYISLSRNYGHQSALRAGLDHADGDVVVSMDADLQHPPELIPALLKKWEEGFEVVYTVRKDPHTLPLSKRVTSLLFYRLINSVSDVHIEPGAADFRLLDRKAVEAINQFKEKGIFFRGIFADMGFKQVGIEYEARERHAHKSRYTLKKMLNLAMNGITGFSMMPLRLSLWVGGLLLIGSTVFFAYSLIARISGSMVNTGWMLLAATMLVIASLQFIMVGILGEYIGRIFFEVKHRPNYIIREQRL